MKTIKVIDLLNKIVNGEEVPEKIKYKDDIYIHVDNYCYFCEETNEILSQNIYAEFNRLNDEVEIIEDTPKEDKKIERIDYLDFNEYSDENKSYCLLNKINEIIKLLNNSMLLSEKEVGKFLDKVNGEDNEN